MARRLARRRSDVLRRPAREGCICARACDHRINAATAALVPEDAIEQRLEHEVLLDKPLLVLLNKAVEIEYGGEEVPDLARKLGVSAAGLYNARKAGLFHQVYYPLLGGKRGKPVPVLQCKADGGHRRLDPCYGQFGRPPDPIWGCLWQWREEGIPDDLDQTVRRVPTFGPTRHGSHIFRGWRWICPGCAKPVRTLYFPLAVMGLAEYLCSDLVPSWAESDHPDAIPKPPPTFACRKCHNVRFFSRHGSSAWHDVVSYFSGGLLYGSEVERPPDFAETAPYPKKRRGRNRRPSKNRERVRELLEAGRTRQEIIAAMGIAERNVDKHLAALRREGEGRPA